MFRFAAVAGGDGRALNGQSAAHSGRLGDHGLAATSLFSAQCRHRPWASGQARPERRLPSDVQLNLDAWPPFAQRD